MQEVLISLAALLFFVGIKGACPAQHRARGQFVGIGANALMNGGKLLFHQEIVRGQQTDTLSAHIDRGAVVLD